MKRLSLMLVVALAATLAATAAAYAQEPVPAVPTPSAASMPRPFGIALGEPLPEGFLAKYACTLAGSGGRWDCDSAPTPTENAASYTVVPDSAGRVVRVLAGWSFSDDPNCVATAEKEGVLVGLLREKYGQPTTMKRTAPGEYCALHLSRRTVAPAFISWLDRDGVNLMIKTFSVNYDSVALVLLYEHIELFAAHNAALRARTQDGL